ncbi:hypothetical protein EON82_06015 [bacterium]|nr:MAG: hypothetical protein EON82_06015 [bacterium]
MIRKAVANLSSMAALVSFLACLCFSGAFVASAFADVRCLGATVVSAVWSHLASVKADALTDTPTTEA